MRVSNSYNQYSANDLGVKNNKAANVRDYSNYLTNKFGCLTPGRNAAVSITSGLLKKAMTDGKTGEWLERELAKAPDYIKAAQQSAAARGDTLKSVSIEFGEEYTTMCTCVVTDTGGTTDPDIDKWLERIKDKKEKQKEEEKKAEKRKEEQKIEESLYTKEFKGRDLEDLTDQFKLALSMQSDGGAAGFFDVTA